MSPFVSPVPRRPSRRANHNTALLTMEVRHGCVGDAVATVGATGDALECARPLDGNVPGPVESYLDAWDSLRAADAAGHGQVRNGLEDDVLEDKYSRRGLVRAEIERSLACVVALIDRIRRAP